MTKIRPSDFQNPYSAYSSEFSSLDAAAVMAQIGIQYDAGTDVQDVRDRVLHALEADASVYQVEAGRHLDAAGYVNDVFLAYWVSRDDYHRWRAEHPLESWVQKPGERSGGLWVEALQVPACRLETSYSTQDARWGMAKNRSKELNPFHSYFGSMRDRIHDAEDGGLPATVTDVSPAAVTSRSRLISFEVPENMCFIRSPQGWRHCPDAERDWFEEKMLPVYQAGVDYLSENPLDTGCLSIRKIDVHHPADAQVQTSSLAWWQSLAHLEAWAHEHPTHLAILQSFGELARHFAPDVTVVLGHEVYVVPAGGARAEYLNCHDRTGLLPFLGHLSGTVSDLIPDH
ncbi:phenylacetaldoxime dehydratase family protein [Streptomyces sp. ME19-01-6]|uniref:phenylacetaldoxime dehydratase family protein n=1 Tax=Streptomyces sp. ME19-01-6 TaxID=3028686 RepID=UPI0029B47139|nr:phenylacetaldoxime dehydratase family protein [Streptomyces sp. ME19-01-6]MDX3233839.1 phenylacetaldoxime dehydratase family protein [Streptomyces sp. ME19-01-6]